jgi:hypothetical protein
MGQIAQDVFVQLVASLGTSATEAQLETAAAEAFKAEAAYQLIESRKGRGG